MLKGFNVEEGSNQARACDLQSLGIPKGLRGLICCVGYWGFEVNGRGGRRGLLEGNQCNNKQKQRLVSRAKPLRSGAPGSNSWL